MRDPELERYVSALEEHLGRRRGREQVLSPPDFALARSWYANGVPVENVIEAIDALVASGRDPTSLTACRRSVEARTHRAPVAVSPPAAAPTTGAGADRLRAIATALAGLPEHLASCFPETRAALAALRARPTPDAALLVRLEDALAREALAALEPAARREIERRLERAAARQRGRLSEDVLARARQQHLETAALRALGLLPR